MCPFPDILKSFVRANLISFFTFCLSSILSEIHKNLYCTYNALYISLLFNFQGSSSPFWATACSLYYHPFFLSREILRFLNIFSAKPKTFDFRAKMEIFGVTKMSFCPCFSGFFCPYAHARKNKKEEGRAENRSSFFQNYLIRTYSFSINSMVIWAMESASTSSYPAMDV